MIAYLLELVDTEDAPGILTVRTGLLSEASAVASVLDGQVLVLQPLSLVESGQRLLRGCDQVLVGLLRTVLGDLVQLLVKLLELGGLGHGVAVHEEGGHVGLVALVEEELETIVDESKVEEETVAGQAVASVSGDLDTTLGVVAVQTGENFVVGQAVLLCDVNTLRGPVANQLVVVLVVADRDRVVDVVANRLCLLQQSDVQFLGAFLLLLVTDLQLVLLLEQIIGIALGLLDLANLFLQCVDLGLDLVGGVLGCAETRRQQHSLGSRRQ